MRWRYHFTHFRTGRLLATLPMVGVKLGEVLNGAADAQGTIPLASPDVRRRNPEVATTPRATCLWAERQELDPATGRPDDSRILWGGVVMKRERSLAAHAMTVSAVSWASYFQRRILGDHLYTQFDKFVIMRALLWEAIQQPPQAGYPTVSPHHEPLNVTAGHPLSGVLADRTYLASDLKPVLEAVTELGASGAGFDWRLVPHMTTPGDLDTLRVRLDLGYPRLGRVRPADLRWSTARADQRQRWGHVTALTLVEDGSPVHNRLTAVGTGTGPEQIRATVDSSSTGRNETAAGYPLYEGSVGGATNDDRTLDTVHGKARGALLAQLSSEVRVAGVRVRGDLPPTLPSYEVGDDCTVKVGAPLADPPLTVVGQLVARTIAPGDAGTTEQVALDIQGTVT